MASSPKIIVFDDDPTGSQTVRGCPLLLEFSSASLEAALADPSPLLFLLTNSRALEPQEVREQLTLICRRLRPLLQQLQRPWLVVSRGDSTLRGHTPLEHDLIRAELGPFHASLLVPAFPQGGRTTSKGVHLLHGEPVHQSPFARDRRFAYPSSDLAQWLEHKSAGVISANAVVRLPQPAAIAQLQPGQWAVADVQAPADLEAIGAVVLQELAQGRRHLCQSAASLINGLAAMPSRLLEPLELPPITAGGVVLVGSHVPLADQQLEQLLAEPSCAGVEFPLQASEADLQRLSAALQAIRGSGRTPVLFSTRGEQPGFTPLQQRQLALRMAQVVLALDAPLGYVIAKGGTTSLTLLQQGLGL
ncbi:MAG: four-carbon acid sugar kinase family protein, partial [Synechococcus sp.]|nr:four-carbon acid sugar kinase family protein [Synechococcus sp.]